MEPKEKAEIIIEALPYIKKYNNKIVVIKFGGNVITKSENVIEDIVLLKNIGIKPVIVHGGGPELTAKLKKLEITSKFINGLRYTGENTIKIAEKVFNKINNEITGKIIHHGTKSVNANDCIKVKQKNPELGLVGEITEINKEKLMETINSGLIPVISPIGTGNDKKSYNINADTTAAHVAVSLNAEKFTILTDVNGIIVDGKLLSHIDFNTAKKEIKKSNINKGMIPKVEACIYAVKNKCPKAHLLNGLTPHSILLEIFTDKGIGTEIVYKNGHKKNY
jgi:acetylglutamate kinase|tara:strand:+ start:1450 stop:2286 length:837 start_codon:yes stop_codon:yes gene_type:complete